MKKWKNRNQVAIDHTNLEKSKAFVLNDHLFINTHAHFSELDDFLQELDEDVEGMQSTILFLQQELKAAKETITNLERENYLLKNGNGASSSNNGEYLISK